MAGLAACSTSFHPQTCSVDTDCNDSALACGAQADGTNACVSAASLPLRVGMSAPASGPNEALGIEMRRGVQLAFDEENDAGGVHGRPVQLDFRDDQYDPALAAAAVKDLLDVQPLTTPAHCPSSTASIGGNPPVSATSMARGPNAVLGMLGDVGTPTMLTTAPIALETSSLFFGAFTGATTLLRDTEGGDCEKYIFNIRASYGEEARATVEYFDKEGVPDFDHVLSFDQNDSFGNAGYNGLVAAYVAEKGPFPSSADPTTPIRRFRYTRNDVTSVPAQVTAVEAYLSQLLSADSANHSIGIMMTDTYGAGVQFITLLRNWQYGSDGNQGTLKTATRLSFFLSNVSFVGPNALAQGLVAAGTVSTPSGSKPYTDGVVVSQVVPNYQSDSSDLVVDYLKALGTSAAPTFTSLEGYAAARVFVAGLQAHTGAFTSDALIPTFESLPPLTFGLGGAASFSSTSHQYSKSVWGTSITATGTFTNLYYWVDGSAIQFFE